MSLVIHPVRLVSKKSHGHKSQCNLRKINTIKQVMSCFHPACFQFSVSCPEGSLPFKDQCFKIIYKQDYKVGMKLYKVGMKHQQAETFCKQQGGQLTSVKSDQTFAAIAATLKGSYFLFRIK